MHGTLHPQGQCLGSLSFDAVPSACVSDGSESRIFVGFKSGAVLIFNLYAKVGCFLF